MPLKKNLSFPTSPLPAPTSGKTTPTLLGFPSDSLVPGEAKIERRDKWHNFMAQARENIGKSAKN